MNIKELKIEGFKSIGSITLKNPNNFSVFVGANASGKSNIFEALELFELINIVDAFEVIKYFGNAEEILNRIGSKMEINFEFNFDEFNPIFTAYAMVNVNQQLVISKFFNKEWGVISKEAKSKNEDYFQFSNFTRLFVGNSKLVKRPLQDDSRLSLDAGNLEKVLKRILKDKRKREEIVEIFQLLIPGFKDIEVLTNEYSGSSDLLIYDKVINRPFPRHLISDGTYNIIAIVTALYQSDEPQFLCIEEPENGLNPKVVRELVTMIRAICKEKGHYIWLNTHSQSLISELTSDEIIIVDKKNGLTQVKQIQGMNMHGLRMDDALLTNAIGGGIPW